jgi:arsenate reductase
VEIWFNPSCSKCGVAREMLEDAGVGLTVRRYLDDPPSTTELRQALDELALEPWDVTRMDEPLAVELGLTDTPHDRAAWIDTLAAHPRLLQRPILRRADGTAWIARTPEAVRQAIAHDASARRPAGRPTGVTTNSDDLVEPEGVNAPGGPAGGPARDRATYAPVVIRRDAGGDEAHEMHPSPLGGSPWQDPDQPDAKPSGDR